MIVPEDPIYIDESGIDAYFCQERSLSARVEDTPEKCRRNAYSRLLIIAGLNSGTAHPIEKVWGIMKKT